jgi:hypothetical protein
MIVFDGSRDLNFAVTPNHDIVTTNGKIEAGELYEQARSRPRHWIPRTVSAAGFPAPYSKDQLRLIGYHLADGYDASQAPNRFRIGVGRPEKIAALEALDLHLSVSVSSRAGKPYRAPESAGVATLDRTVFTYDRAALSDLVGPGKSVQMERLWALSREQARTAIDAWVEFDGHTAPSGVQRLYCSRPDLLDAIEVLAVRAGYAVSARKQRGTDAQPNWWVTISGRDEMPVRRWGTDERRGLERRESNPSGKVWCVTVPSGVIVVRRRGFSMLCGNCAVANALREAFSLSGLYDEAEMARRLDGGATEVDEVESNEPLWGDDELGQRLQQLVKRANELKSGSYRIPKVQGILRAATREDREVFANELEKFIAAHDEEDDVVDAVVVEETEPDEDDRAEEPSAEEIAAKRARLAELEAALEDAGALSDQQVEDVMAEANQIEVWLQSQST